MFRCGWATRGAFMRLDLTGGNTSSVINVLNSSVSLKAANNYTGHWVIAGAFTIGEKWAARA